MWSAPPRGVPGLTARSRGRPTGHYAFVQNRAMCETVRDTLRDLATVAKEFLQAAIDLDTARASKPGWEDGAPWQTYDGTTPSRPQAHRRSSSSPVCKPAGAGGRGAAGHGRPSPGTADAPVSDPEGVGRSDAAHATATRMPLWLIAFISATTLSVIRETVSFDTEAP